MTPSLWRKTIKPLQKALPGRMQAAGALLRRLGSKLGRKGTIGLLAGLPIAGAGVGALLSGGKKEKQKKKEEKSE